MKIKRLIIPTLASLLFVSCNKDIAPGNQDDNGNNSDAFRLEFVGDFPLDVKEPSGLSWDFTGENLLMVSDNTNKAYVVDLHGITKTALVYQGDDTEGITVNRENREIWIAEEAKSKLVKLDSAGVKKAEYDIPAGATSAKKGLEGLTYNEKTKEFYILNEDEPGLLIKWKPSSGIIVKKQLDFAGDYSGIYYDGQIDKLWIVSDRSQKLYLCDLNGVVLQDFSLDYDKAEGVVADIDNQRLYIVSDSQQKLYEYKIIKK